MVLSMIFSLMNGALWLTYGYVVSDPFIAVPNGFGAALGIVQVALCLLFPRHSHRPGDDGRDGIMKRVTSIASDVSTDHSTSTHSLSLPEESTPLI